MTTCQSRQVFSAACDGPKHRCHKLAHMAQSVESIGGQQSITAAADHAISLA